MSSETVTGAHVKVVRVAKGGAFALRPPGPDEALSTITYNPRRGLSLEFLTLAAAAVLAAAGFGIGLLDPLVRYGNLLLGRNDTLVVVERIIRAESNGNASLKNPRSSAVGSGQFLNQTWLEMIRSHRSDLLHGRTEQAILDLRTDPALVREITARMVEKNRLMLKKRGLPVTPATLYLAHFAGPAGAVAVLTVADDNDAALVLARADASGRTTREKLVKANPFLDRFTVGDLKTWADRRMKS